jgi:hypothetical protein
MVDFAFGYGVNEFTGVDHLHNLLVEGSVAHPLDRDRNLLKSLLEEE